MPWRTCSRRGPAVRAASVTIGRIGAPEHGLGFWIALWALVIAAEFAALVPVIWPDEEQRRDRAGDLPADRRIVRGVRAHRLAQAARQPQRHAHDRGGRGLLPVGDHRPVRPAARADRVDPGAGAVGAVLRGAGADAADGRPARVARRLAAGGRLRAGAAGSCSSSGCSSSSRTATCWPRSRTRTSPTRSTRASARSPASPASRSRSSSPCDGGRRRGRAGAPCCRASRAASRCCSSPPC